MPVEVFGEAGVGELCSASVLLQIVLIGEWRGAGSASGKAGRRGLACQPGEKEGSRDVGIAACVCQRVGVCFRGEGAGAL